MKALVKVPGEKIFRNKAAIELYDKMSNRLHVIEYGKDNKGYIYFHWANGVTDRYSRREFLHLAIDVKSEYYDHQF